jgi:hypothetical protein
MNATPSSSTENPIHKWLPTIVAGLTAIGIIWTGASQFAEANARIKTLEQSVSDLQRTVKSLKPAPTAKEQQCDKVLDRLSMEVTQDFGNKSVELRQLATDMGCVHPSK